MLLVGVGSGFGLGFGAKYSAIFCCLKDSASSLVENNFKLPFALGDGVHYNVLASSARTAGGHNFESVEEGFVYLATAHLGYNLLYCLPFKSF